MPEGLPFTEGVGGGRSLRSAHRSTDKHVNLPAIELVRNPSCYLPRNGVGQHGQEHLEFEPPWRHRMNVRPDARRSD